MTREEEIINAAREARMASAETLTTRGTHHSIDDVPFIKIITYDEVAENAFIKGAEWADAHPINVWHDASEEPEIGSNIVAIDRNGQWWVIQPYDDDYKGCRLKGWESCVHNYNNIQKWAYISDLLPKGGIE